MAVRVLRPLIRAPGPGDARALEQAERECFPDPWPGHLLLSEIRAPGRFHRLAVAPDGELVEASRRRSTDTDPVQEARRTEWPSHPPM